MIGAPILLFARVSNNILARAYNSYRRAPIYNDTRAYIMMTGRACIIIDVARQYVYIYTRVHILTRATNYYLQARQQI